MRAWKDGGTDIRKTKTFSLKFADDVAMAEDTAEGPSDMNETLEKYTKRNELKVNTNETKTAIFRKRG